jgi:hypothetical protein
MVQQLWAGCRTPKCSRDDVGHEEHYVAIAPTRDEVPVQRFGCFTAELVRMAVGPDKLQA